MLPFSAVNTNVSWELFAGETVKRRLLKFMVKVPTRCSSVAFLFSKIADKSVGS